MELELRQGGRAAMDFMVELTAAVRPLSARWGRELAQAGVTAGTLPDDLDARRAAVDEALAGSRAFATAGLALEFASVEHGRVATRAYEEIADRIDPELARLEAAGPATLAADPDFVPPAYYQGVWFHRTSGGWDGHPQQGLIHGELIHRHYVAKNFPGDIFAQRRRVLAELPRRDYATILEMGASSGHYTQAIQEVFPDARIIGIDVSLPMLRQALRVANANGWAWDLRRRAAEDTGLPDASIDLVTSYIILHEMPASAIRAVFREALRVLRPGGQMLMSDVTPFRVQDRLSAWRADWLAVHGGEPYWREAATLDWSEAARHAGFVEVCDYGVGGAPYPWIVIGTKPT